MKASAARAAARQLRLLGDMQVETADLEIRPLSRPSARVKTYGVAAADAGLVSVELAPFSLEFLYVADDTGRVFLSEFFPLTTLAKDLEDIFQRNTVLASFADRLNLEWEELTELWERQTKHDRAFPRDVRLVADTLRELAEWAVCMELAAEPGVADGISRIVLHDGLLRSILLRSDVISERMPAWFHQAWTRSGTAMVGVSKSSLLWQRLGMIIELDDRAHGIPEYYVVVPPDVEERFADRSPGGRRLGFGTLILLKSHLHQSGTFLPVDMPPWLLKDRATTELILGQLLENSCSTFPRPGYPEPLGKAHDAAHLTEFDAKVIRDQVIAALRELMPNHEFERLLRGWAFQPQVWEKSARFVRK